MVVVQPRDRESDATYDLLRRHCGRVMVHDLTIVAVLQVGEAVARGDRFGFAVLRVE
jgi:hypothetical protein